MRLNFSVTLREVNGDGILLRLLTLFVCCRLCSLLIVYCNYIRLFYIEQLTQVLSVCKCRMPWWWVGLGLWQRHVGLGWVWKSDSCLTLVHNHALLLRNSLTNCYDHLIQSNSKWYIAARFKLRQHRNNKSQVQCRFGFCSANRRT